MTDQDIRNLLALNRAAVAAREGITMIPVGTMNPELVAAGLTDQAIDDAVVAWFAGTADGIPPRTTPAQWLRTRMRKAVARALAGGPAALAIEDPR